jgi:predicted RNase H-like nuclease (RuvC/YqgF family)
MIATPQDPSALTIPYPDTPERRLRRALRQLDAALAEQREAVGAFRAQLGVLKGSVEGLGARMSGLQARLGEAAAEAEAARIASRELSATAAAMERLAQR